MDVFKGMLCPCCSASQIDLEIRMREGEEKLRMELLRKSHGAMESTTSIQLPPPAIEPMRYISPRATSEHTSNHSGEPTSHPQDREDLHEDQAVTHPRSRVAFLGLHGNDGSDEHDPETTQLGNGETGLDQNSMDSLAIIRELSSERQDGPEDSNETQHHVQPPEAAISSNIASTTPKDNSVLVTRDSAVVHVGADTETRDTTERISMEDGLTASEARDAVTSLRSKRNNLIPGGAEQLSYVHDFSDECLVNKSVLMYYEKEENQAKDPDSKNGSPSNLLSNNPYQQILSGDLPGPEKKNIAGKHEEPSHQAGSYSKLADGEITASSHYEGSEVDRDGSNNHAKAPKTHSDEGSPQLPPPYEANP